MFALRKMCILAYMGMSTSSLEKPPHERPRLVRSTHTLLIGLSIVSVAIALTIGMFVQIAGYRLVAIDRRDPEYPSVVTRQITRDTPMPPFVAKYPVTPSSAVNATIQQYIHSLINAYIKERSARTGVGHDVQLQIGYTLRWYDNLTMTIDFTSQKHQINRIWDKHTETVTVDLASGKRIGPDDIIVNSLDLANMLYDNRRANNTPSWSSAELIDLLDLTPQNITNVVPYGDTVSFTYKIGTRTETVAIKKAFLVTIVAPTYQVITVDKNIREPTFTELISTPPSRDEPVTPVSKKLALTFDDGPGGDTPRLLDTLYKYRAKATFFVIGKNVAPHATILKREVADGHEIGNHTWAHPNLRTLSSAAIASQIQDTQTAIQQASGGYTPQTVRPPYGVIDGNVSAHLQGLRPAFWSIDTLDWLDRDTNVIYDRIMAGAQQNAIILLHDIHPHSVDAAIRAIRQLRTDGWQLVTVSQL